MNKQLISKWAKTLRNPNVAQARGAVKKVNRKTGEISLCCLGVLTEKVLKKDLIMEPSCTSDKDIDSASFNNGWGGAIPEEAANMLGTRISVNIFGKDAYVLNDGELLTFDEIADLLEIAVMEGEGVE
jgi:hypothetical protein